jgi:hypothetical protein
MVELGGLRFLDEQYDFVVFEGLAQVHQLDQSILGDEEMLVLILSDYISSTSPVQCSLQYVLIEF